MTHGGDHNKNPSNNNRISGLFDPPEEIEAPESCCKAEGGHPEQDVELRRRAELAHTAIQHAKSTAVGNCLRGISIPLPTGMPAEAKGEHHIARRAAILDFAFGHVRKHGRYPVGQFQVRYKLRRSGGLHEYTYTVDYPPVRE